MFEYQSIFKFIRKHITLRDILIATGLTLFYFGLRLINLEGLPIFSDEGIYINWAKIGASDPAWRFISLTDGKQPLQTWLTIPMLKLFAENPLFAGRIVSVLTGFVALSGIFTLLTYIFNKRTGYIGALLYIITPYFLFYDRIALIDSGVNAGYIWILFLSILLVRTNRLDVALIYGLVAGITLLAKSSGRLFIALSAFAPVLIFTTNRKKFIPYAINFLFLLGVGAFLALVIYNIQRLSPFFYMIEQKNDTFLLSTEEFLSNPFKVVFHNLPLIPYYIFSELGYVIGIFGVAGLYKLWKKDMKMALYFSLWIGLPYIAVAFFAEVLFPRYIIFLATSFLLLAAYFLSQLKTPRLQMGAMLAILLSTVWFNYSIIADHKNIPFPPVDKGQYIMDWPAGWGMKEVVEYVRTESTDPKRPILILAEGNFGKSGDVLNTLRIPGDTYIVDGIWPLNLEKVKDTQKKLEDHRVLVVFHRRTDFPPDWPIKLIKKFDYPNTCKQNLIDKALKQECPPAAALYLFELTRD